jgi:FKBP-type peptidyl-prolyl cis-trans isomerase
MNLMRLVIAALSCASLMACSEAPQPPPSAASQVTELQQTDLVVGAGAPIAAGQTAVVHYTGWLYAASTQDHKQDHRGKEFDSSRTRGQPFRFLVGGGQVIKGWDEGVVGMQVGGQRRLVIPPDFGYGARGGGPIPPNSTLIFDVELLAIE